MSTAVPASSSNIRRRRAVGAAPAALFDRRPPRGSGDLVELIADLGVGRLGQYRQLAERRRRRRGAVGELVDAVAIARPVDGELSRRQRAEAFDHLLRVAVRIAAAMPAPRRQPGEGLVDAGDPRLLGAAGVAHQAAREQLGETLVQRLRQRLERGPDRAMSTSITARSSSILKPVVANRLRSHAMTSASVTRCRGQPFSIDRLPSFSNGVKPLASMARRKAVQSLTAAPDAAGTLLEPTSCRAPGRASFRRRCRRRRRHAR